MKLGGVKFFVKGVNQERAFTTLSSLVNIFSLKRTSNTTAEFCVDMQYEKFVERKITELNLKIDKKKRFGILNQLTLFFKRFGIIAGIFISLTMQIVFSYFVFSVKIIGLETINENEVETVLKENNLYGFIYKGALNKSDVEKTLMNEFDKISMVSAIIKGNTLIISIKEKVINDEYENADNFSSLKSQYDCLITDIKLISGTLKVKVGQIVQYGDVLVEPYIIDSSGERRAVKAEAEINARVWYTGHQTHFSERLEVVKTGNKTRYVNLTFLGFNLINNLKKEPAYTSYETVINTKCISNFNILPIYRQEIIYYETKQILVEEDFESVKENILQKAKEMALNLVEECDIINKEYFNVTTENKITYVEYVIEVEKRIDIL